MRAAAGAACTHGWIHGCLVLLGATKASIRNEYCWQGMRTLFFLIIEKTDRITRTVNFEPITLKSGLHFSKSIRSRENIY